MIKLISLQVENYRSIIGDPVVIAFDSFTSVVGPNNCGKSNILRALQLFFTGAVEGRLYSSDVDFPKTEALPKHAQTKITVVVTFDSAKDVVLARAIDELEENSDQKRLDGNQISLRLSYSKNGVESWGFIGKFGARNIKKELIIKVRDCLRQSVVFKYIPVGRDSLDSITHEIGAELITTIFSGWSGAVKKRQNINDAISNLLGKLKPELVNSSRAVTSSMKAVFYEIQNLELQLPFSNLEEMLPSLRPVLRDTAETGLKSKGAGIQTSSLLFLLKYLADNYPQRYVRQTFIWAIEEPESFLHPTKQRAMAQVLLQFSGEVQTVITTHCAHFVPRQLDGVACFVVDKAKDSPWGTEVIGNSYDLARQTLGVTLLDSMSLFPVNLVVEGPSDEIILMAALKKLGDGAPLQWFDIKFFPAGNASSASYLFEWLSRQSDSSVAVRLVIDGDKPGNDALNGLLNRGRRDDVTWKANHDYFQMPIDTENLLSDRIKCLLAEMFPAQVQATFDIDGALKTFKILDGHKKSIAAKSIELSDRKDLKGFRSLFEKIAKSLKR